MSYWTTELSNWPFMSQLGSPTADGAPSEDRAEACGETCLAMTTRWLAGVLFYPDTIKDLILGQNALGVTNITQLQSWLVSFAETPSTQLSPSGVTGPGSLTNLIWSYTVKGQPLIGLYYYSDTDRVPHWRQIIGIDPSIVIMADPWTGQRYTEDYATNGRRFLGQLLGIDRTRDPFLG